MMPTFGTRPTLKSGIAHTWSVSLTVAFSRMSGPDGCGACNTIARHATVVMIFMSTNSTLARGILHHDVGRRGDYGYDAPYALISFAVLGAAATFTAIALVWSQRGGRPAAMFGFYGAFFLGNALSFFYTTTRGKFRVWEDILDELSLRGDERVLDMGCGRGAVLTAVARRLTTGRAIGVDLWSTHDQSGNSRDVAIRNASLEGVQDRIDVQTADM